MQQIGKCSCQSYIIFLNRTRARLEKDFGKLDLENDRKSCKKWFLKKCPKCSYMWEKAY